MAMLTPLWMQDGSYPASSDRQLIQVVLGAQERILAGLEVGPSDPAALSVVVSAGILGVRGDDTSNQGFYLCVSTASETITMPPAPGSGQRIDLVIGRVNDPQAGGPAGVSWSWVVEQGTPAGSNPTPPAVPTSAVAVASVLRSEGDGPISGGMITNIGPRAAQSLFGIIATTNPVGTGAPNDLWIRI